MRHPRSARSDPYVLPTDKGVGSTGAHREARVARGHCPAYARAVAAHISNIMNKLGLNSRAQIAVWMSSST